MKIDVLVVGAGPVGLTMAAELARYGLSVRIVEKAAEPTDKSKAIVVWSRTLELMDRMGCTSEFLWTGTKVTTANITAGDHFVGRISLDGVATPYPFALMIPQSDTERLMSEHLAALGVYPERQVELVGFETTEVGVVSTLRGADGDEEEVESSWLVGCDGAHSTVRHLLGMDFQGNTLPSDWILADVHLSGVPNPGEMNAMWHADGVLVIFPIAGDRYRVIADAGPDRRPDPTLEEVQEVLDRRGPGGIVASKPIWLAAFRINERKVREYRAGRVFLAGDAAHIHSPAGGQGMNTGMQDAINLAWKLAMVCKGLAAENPLLDSYSVERSAVGDQVLKGAGRFTAIATLTGEIKQAIRNQLLSFAFGLAPVRHVMADAFTEVSIGYPHSPLNVYASGAQAPNAGTRAPLRENETPVGAGETPLFAIYAGAEDELGADVRVRFSHLLEPALRAPFHSGGIWLVRPDGYVAVAASDWKAVAAFLEKIIES